MARAGTVTMYRGDAKVITFSVFDSDDAALDVTGSDFWFTAKKNLSDTDANAKAQYDTTNNPDNIEVTDAANGIVTVTMDPADTTAFTGDTTLWYDLQLVDALGSPQTLIRGQLKVLVDVTVNTVIV